MYIPDLKSALINFSGNATFRLLDTQPGPRDAEIDSDNWDNACTIIYQ